MTVVGVYTSEVRSFEPTVFPFPVTVGLLRPLDIDSTAEDGARVEADGITMEVIGDEFRFVVSFKF